MHSTSKITTVFAALVFTLVGASAWAAPESGDRTLTLSGTGSSDNDFDTNNFGMTGELGWFLNDSLETGVRQSVNVIARDDAADDWSGGTRIFANWHFGGRNAFQPFVGLSGGGFYGEHVKDTFAAGPELGMKYYVKDKTFIELQVEYQFLFEDADEIDDRFDDGAFFYTLGIGYNF